MKIALIITGIKGKFKKLFSVLCKELKNNDVAFETIAIEDINDKIIIPSASIYKSDLIVLGCPALPWKGRIPERLKEFVDTCAYLEGKKVAVFVGHHFWGAKAALKELMDVVEKKGAFIFDFEILRKNKDIKEFTKRLISVTDSINIL